MLTLCMVTKVKVFFLVLVYVFNFDLFEFSAAILEKGLLYRPARKSYSFVRSFIHSFILFICLFTKYSNCLQNDQPKNNRGVLQNSNNIGFVINLEMDLLR